MKNLTSRVISAIVALTIFISVIYFFKSSGALVLIGLVVARCSFEINRMLFKDNYPHFARYFYIFSCVSLFLILVLLNIKAWALFFILLFFMAFVVVAILFHKSFKDIQTVAHYVSLSSFGLVYTSLIPILVAWTVQSENGLVWFLFLLAAVFSGDIGAYLFGVTIGKIKLAPLLSPNKSLQGSVGGLLFSTLSAFLFAQYLTETPLIVLLVCGFLGGALGQIGDFFESLIKRVSGVKDSGTIMPGHGGVLDRLDGVLMAAPLFFYAANYHSLWS